MAIKTVFFDIGDVLFNEDAPHAIMLHCILQAARRAGVDVTWDQYAGRFRQCMRSAPNPAPRDALAQFVPDPAECARIFDAGHDMYQATRHPRPYGILLDDMTAVVDQVRARYRTGIVANQHPAIMEALTDYGLVPKFDVIVIDEIVGVSKPDPRIFEIALERAGCAAAEAVMVGDRADHDIRPAKGLGMGTVRFRRGTFYVHYDPLSDAERADFEVREAAHIPPAIDLVAGIRAQGASI